MIDIESTGLRRSARVSNKPKQKYGLFDKFWLSVIGAYDVAKKLHIFPTRANQHFPKINRHFDETLHNFCPIIFTENQEQNKSYTFKDVLLQPYRSDFIPATVKEVELHKTRSHWTFTKNSEFKNNNK